jgi:hypothetical protein
MGLIRIVRVRLKRKILTLVSVELSKWESRTFESNASAKCSTICPVVQTRRSDHVSQNTPNVRLKSRMFAQNPKTVGK